ncbi:hypothetical protein [Streptomyces olivaceoviridis]|uniref:hypothetical protein n=1 Tax=Streptomyces olivaceoviridis TaxID=1921 RepID=UPI0036C4E5AC
MPASCGCPPLGLARAHGRELAPRRPDQTAAPDVLRVPEAVHLVTSWPPEDGHCRRRNAGVEEATARWTSPAVLREPELFRSARRTPAGTPCG